MCIRDRSCTSRQSRLSRSRLIEDSNRYTAVIKGGFIGSIDGRIAIAGDGAVLIEPRLEGEIDSDPFWQQRPEAQITTSVSYTHLRAHETGRNLVCRLLLE